MSEKLIEIVEREFEDAVVDSHSQHGDDTVTIERDSLREIIAFLKNDDATKLNFLRLVTAVDYLRREPRFEVVYILYSVEHKHSLTVRVSLAEDDCVVPSIHDIFQNAAWFEREVWDFYGVDFADHPDLRRVLNYEEFEGHPLRKDYPKQKGQPRTELLERERDSVEEFEEYVKKKPSAGSRDI